MPVKLFLVNENFIMWGFRYALGRRTGAVMDACEILKVHWNKLQPFTRRQIHAEIKEAINSDRAGAECDVKEWSEILDLIAPDD